MNSVDWTINATELQQNIEIIIYKTNDNFIEFDGYAWHFNYGYIEIKKKFKRLHQNKNVYYSGKYKIFLFKDFSIRKIANPDTDKRTIKRYALFLAFF